MFRSRAGLIAVVATASLGWGVAPAVAQSPPPNDNYLASTIIPQGSTTGMKLVTYHDTENLTAATTQGDLFNPDQSGLQFAGGGPEPLTCGPAHYGQTIWYDVHPKVPEGVQVTANGVPNVIAVYRWSTKTSKIVARLGCQAAANGANTVNLPSELQKGDAYTVQVGALSSASGPVTGTVAVSATFLPDHDGDGVYDPLDACPLLAGIGKLGGCPPALSPNVNWGTVGQRLTEFQVGSLPAGARILVRCSCGVSASTTVGAHARTVSLTALVNRTVPTSATLQLWATKRPSGTGTYRFGAIGGYLRYTMRAGGLGEPVKRCLLPGSLTPRRQCPAGGRRPVPASSPAGGREVARP
jgi:hypothetical protein